LAPAYFAGAFFLLLWLRTARQYERAGDVALQLGDGPHRFRIICSRGAPRAKKKDIFE